MLVKSQIQTQIGKPILKKENAFKRLSKRAFEGLGRIGKALLFPIAVLPIAAILNRLAAQLPTNTGIENADAFVTFVQSVLSSVGSTVFDNLHILFAVGVVLD